MTRILVVDDEVHITHILRRCLSSEGFEVTIARDGAEALEILAKEEFGAMVTDICMPRMTGRELCEAYREENPDSPMFIFVSTSRPERDQREWTKTLGRLEFIEKPVSLRNLVSRIRDCLGIEE